MEYIDDFELEKEKENDEDYDYDTNMSSIMDSYVENFKSTRNLTAEEEIKYAEAWQKNKDQEARDIMVINNLRLVVSIAKRYLNAAKLTNLDLMDIIQYGNLGLLKAVDCFDTTLGYRFTTYATYWIKQSIMRYMSYQGYEVKIPTHEYTKYIQIYKLASKNYIEKDLPINFEAIDAELEFKEGESEKIFKLMENATMFRLEAPITEKDGEPLNYADILKSDKLVEDDVIHGVLQEEIDKVMQEIFTEKEYDIMCQRFGLNGKDPKTLDEISIQYGCTRERIRQIQEKCLRKLKHPARAKKLRDFYDKD